MNELCDFTKDMVEFPDLEEMIDLINTAFCDTYSVIFPNGKIIGHYKEIGNSGFFSGKFSVVQGICITSISFPEEKDIHNYFKGIYSFIFRDSNIQEARDYAKMLSDLKFRDKIIEKWASGNLE